MANDFRIDEVPVAIMHLDDFMVSLPACFKRGYQGKIYHDPDDANLFLDDRTVFVNAKKKIVKVKDSLEFAQLKRRLLTVPTYITVTLCNENVDIEKLTGTWHHFMVCFNPKHPEIRSELVENLKNCEELLDQGKHFSFCFRLGPSLCRWYEIVNDMPFYTGRCFNSSICVTNFTEERAMCYSPLLWTTLFPVMVLICGPYILYRFIACKDLSVQVRACIMLVIPNESHGPTSRQDHLCVIKRKNNPWVSTTMQQPNLYELELSHLEEMNMLKRHSLYHQTY